MRIQVLGSGCPTCKKLLERTKAAVEELHIHAEVEYVTDVQQIVSMGFMQSPVLAIDNKPVLVGHVPDTGEIKAIISKAISQ